MRDPWEVICDLHSQELWPSVCGQFELSRQTWYSSSLPLYFGRGCWSLTMQLATWSEVTASTSEEIHYVVAGGGATPCATHLSQLLQPLCAVVQINAASVGSCFLEHAVFQSVLLKTFCRAEKGPSGLILICFWSILDSFTSVNWDEYDRHVQYTFLVYTRSSVFSSLITSLTCWWNFSSLVFKSAGFCWLVMPLYWPKLRNGG